MKKCKDCNKTITNRAIRCNHCNLVFRYLNNVIQQKISETAKKHWKNGNYIKRNYKFKPRKEFICKICNKPYIAIREQVTCRQEECTRKSRSLNRIEAIKAGKTNFNSIKCFFNFKENLIKCDSKIEYSCLDYFVKSFNIINIERCDFYIEYLMNNKIHRFLPDFKITMPGNTYIVEVKSPFVFNRLNKKWRFYNETQKYKKEVLIDYCKKNNYKYFWFVKDLHRKFYNNVNLKRSILIDKETHC